MRPLMCIQNSGEVVYLPAGWAHLTVNLDEVIGAGARRIFGLGTSYKSLPQQQKHKILRLRCVWPFFAASVAEQRGMGVLREQ